MKFKALRGTKDILPGEVERWQYVENKIREVMARYHYREIRTPIFEAAELFARGIGESTDIVAKEMYTFVDRGGRSITLRPEGTAPVIRAYLEHNLGVKSPLIKLFYISPMFRYEKPQAGRYREHHQFGAEAIGSDDPAQDAELISLLMDILSQLGLDSLPLLLNSLGCARCRPDYRERLKEYLTGRLGRLCPDCQARYRTNPLRILDCKKEKCRQAMEDVPLMVDFLCEDCARHFKEVRGYLELLEIDYVLEGRLVRGLDYYTRTTFEVVSEELGAQDAVGGGGRYDGLVEELGGQPTPAVGFAAGLERLMMVMGKRGIFPPEPKGVDLFIAPLGGRAKKLAMRILRKVRSAGINCEMDFLQRSLKAQMKEADRIKARFVLIVGENELQTGRVLLRDMEKGQQEELPLEGFVSRLMDKIGS